MSEIVSSEWQIHLYADDTALNFIAGFVNWATEKLQLLQMYFFHKLVLTYFRLSIDLTTNVKNCYLMTWKWDSIINHISSALRPGAVADHRSQTSTNCLKCLPPWTKSFPCLFWQGEFWFRHQYTLTYKRPRSLLLQSGHMEGCWPGRQTDRSLSNGLTTWLSLYQHISFSLSHLYDPCTQETPTCLNDN